MVVVHGHHAARMQRIAHCLCSGGIHCVNAPYWHQHGVHRADGRCLLHRQLVPQIAQMGHRQAAGCKNPDRVGPPQRAAPVIHDRLPLGEVAPLTEKEYFTCGCTALLDAVGGAIHHIGNIHKYARREDVPEKTMFIITTDGYENASRRYDYERVRRMIERQKERYGWEFLFLGANMDAVQEAARFGISAERAVDYKCDEVGTALKNRLPHYMLPQRIIRIKAMPINANGKTDRKWLTANYKNI